MNLVSFTIIRPDSSEPEVCVYGPFQSHQAANAYMQRRYDEKMEELDGIAVDSDDSDASHFYIAGDDQEWHWNATELERPED